MFDKYMSFIASGDVKKIASLDIETTGLDRHRDEINTLQVFLNIDGKYNGCYIEYHLLTQEQQKAIVKELNKFKYVTHNGKFDMLFVYEKTGVSLDLYQDTLVMAHVLGEEELGLKPLVEKYFGDSYDISTDDKKSKDSHLVKKYAMKDAYYNLKLYKLFVSKLIQEGLKYVYSYELRAYKAYYEVEKTGVPISPRRMEIKQKLVNQIEPLEKELKQVADINFNSPKQLVEVLYNPKGQALYRDRQPYYIVADKKTDEEYLSNIPSLTEARKLAKELANEKGITLKTKKVIPQEKEIYGHSLGLESKTKTTARQDLMKFIDEPFVANLLEYKKLTKLVSFIDSWEDLQVDGRIYPSFNITARTGRTTCKEPNLKNAEGSFTEMCQKNYVNSWKPSYIYRAIMS